MAMDFVNARWIWNNSCRGVNVYVDFEDFFTLDVLPERCHILISCDRNYVFFLNDRFIDCGQYADYEDMKFYDELDIARSVKKGVNRLHFIIYYQGESSFTYKKGEPGLIFEVFADGITLCASSAKTATWKDFAFADGPEIEKVTMQLGFSFRYDSTLADSRAGEKQADIVEKTYDLLPRPVKKLKILDLQPADLVYKGRFCDTAAHKIPAVRMQNADIYTEYCGAALPLPSKGIRLSAENGGKQRGILAIVDLKKECTGFLSLDIEMPCEGDILIGWGEHLFDLRVRTSVGGRCFAASYHAKAGRNRFANPLLRCGARYIQLHIYAPECIIFYAGMRQTLYPIEKIFKFRCSGHVHNRIYETCVRTLLLCMHEHYEDCPWREQALYAMDSRNQMLCGYYAFGETQFAAASIALLAHSMRPDNLLSLTAPSEFEITIPAFSAIFPTMLYEYLKFSKDTIFAEKILPAAERLAGEFIRRIEKSTGLLRRFAEKQYWNFYEWRPGLDGGTMGKEIKEDERTFDAPLNAFVSMGLRSLARICGILGLPDKKEYYDKLRLKLNASCDEYFYDKVRECYASYMKDGGLFHYCELTNALLVYADAVPKERLENVLSKLAGGKLLRVSLSHSIFKYEALMSDPEKYGRFVFEDIARIWGGMLEKGATTFWETVDGNVDFDYAGSLCHGWSAIPVILYFKYAPAINSEISGIHEINIK